MNIPQIRRLAESYGFYFDVQKDNKEQEDIVENER